MQRLSVRRSTSVAETIAFGLAGLGFGFAAGFVARGLVGDFGPEQVRDLVARLSSRPVSVSSRRAAERMAAALARDPDLGGLRLETLPVRGGRVELHGWVPSRRAGARAVHLAHAAAPEVELTNRLLVRGEDDAPPEPPAEERRPA